MRRISRPIAPQAHFLGTYSVGNAHRIEVMMFRGWILSSRKIVKTRKEKEAKQNKN